MSVWKPILWIDQRTMIQSICSCYSSLLLRFHRGLYWNQFVETHQMRNGMACLMSFHSNLLSKGWFSELNSLPTFYFFLVSRLYYIFFILWFLIELLYLLIVDVKSFVFVVIKFMQPIKHQWDQSICYPFISVIFDGAANDILLHFCLGTHHICSCTLLTGFTISAVIASLLHFLYFLLLQTS